ncbi:MAG: CARDB domain-containing protein, partial [Patescibacteria group bacterium]
MFKFKKSYLFIGAVLICWIGVLSGAVGVVKADTTAYSIKPDLIISDIKVEKRDNDSWKYIYITVKNNGKDALSFNQIMGITIKDLDTGRTYGSGLTDKIIAGYSKDVSSADPIAEKSSGIYNLEATVDTNNTYDESNENNNTFTKTITTTIKPDLIISDIKVEKRDNDSWKYIYITVKNNGGDALSFNQ